MISTPSSARIRAAYDDASSAVDIVSVVLCVERNQVVRLDVRCRSIRNFEVVGSRYSEIV